MWSFIVLAIYALGYAHAQQCNNIAFGDYTNCYALRTSCHYDISSSSCLSNAPVNCPQYVTDAIGCSAATFNGLPCSINAATGMCMEKNPGTTTCQKSYTTQASCSTSGCFWDVYLESCWDSLTQVYQSNPCSTWTTYDNTGAACTFHNCAYSAGSCTDIGAVDGAQNSNAVAVTSNVVFANPQIIAPTANYSNLNFSFQVVTPLVVSDGSPQWGWLTLGSYTSQTDLTLPACTTSVNHGAVPQTFNVTKTYGQSVAASQQAIVSGISSTGSMTFTNATINGTINSLLLGNQTNNGFVTSISTLSNGAGQYSTVYNVNFPLVQYVATCASTGLSVVTTSQGYQYTIPAVYNMQSPYTGVIQSYDNLYVTISNSGQVSISPTTPYYMTATLGTVAVETANCLPGQYALFMSYFITYSSVYDTTVQIGPRSVSDVYNASPFNNTQPNCYGDHITTFQFLGCSNNQCVYYMEFFTACTTLRSDGTSFTTCTTNPSMAGNHNFYVNTFSCPLGNPTSANCTSVNPSSTTLSVVQSNITVSAFSGTTINQQYTVVAGLLPTPTDTNINDVQLLAASNGTAVGNNNKIYSNNSLVIVIEMATSALQAAFDLRLVTSGITIQGLDASGNPVAGNNTLTWNQIAPYIQYVTKNQQLNQTGALLLPLVSSQEQQFFNNGFDGFALSAYALRSMLLAQSYKIVLPYYFIIGTHQYSSAGRKLSQLAFTEQQNGVSSAIIYIDDQPPPIFDSNHGIAVYTIFVIITMCTIGWTIVVAYITHRYAVNYADSRKLN